MKLCLYGILLVAVLADLRTYKIPNMLIAIGLCAGTFYLGSSNDYCGLLYGICQALAVVLVLYPLFILRALGAGDIKLISVVVLFLGIEKTATITVTSLLIGALAGLIKLAYLVLVKKEKILGPVKKGKIALAGRWGANTIHFSIYILISVFVVMEVMA